MAITIVPIALLSLLTAFPSLLHAARPDTGLSAYHTRTNPEGVGHIGKFEDLIVTLGKTNRLEFTRANGYQPQWRTASETHQVENLIPNTTEDPNILTELRTSAVSALGLRPMSPFMSPASN